MAIQLVFHTFRMVFGNLGQALRNSIGPYLILIVVVAIGFALAGVPINGTFDPLTQSISPAAFLLPLLMLPLILFISSWVAVSWHRFILLEEYAGVLPAVSDRPIWPYAGKAILLGLIMVLIAIPVMLIFGTLMTAVTTSSLENTTLDANGLPQLSTSSYFRTGIVNAIVSIPIYYVALRIGIALVGTALGKRLGFGEAWRATVPVGGMIFGVTVIMTVVNFVPGLLIISLQSTAPLVANLLNIVMIWATMMLGISILTTIYGHVIEKRPLIS